MVATPVSPRPNPQTILPLPDVTAYDVEQANHDYTPTNPTNLERLETNTSPDTSGCTWEPEPKWELTPLEKTFRHGFWASRRERVYAALQTATVPVARLVNFANCGAGARVYVNQETGAVRVEGSRCNDRFCQACQQARSARLQVALAARVPLAKTLHVVLTLKSSTEPLGKQLTRLYRSASKLRQSPFWKRNVTGGMAAVEITRNETTGQWHPHMHMLVHSWWLDQQDLSRAWLKATGDSTIVHVSLVQREDAAIREVTKYLAKPIHRSIDFHPGPLLELIQALKGRHLIITFGTWRSDPLLKDDVERDEGVWKCWGTLDHLHLYAARGDTWAKQALLYLTSLAPGRERKPAPPALPAG